jgi:hypothetical protein
MPEHFRNLLAAGLFRNCKAKPNDVFWRTLGSGFANDPEEDKRWDAEDIQNVEKSYSILTSFIP